jgi:curved DNA-binding protein CbpA
MGIDDSHFRMVLGVAAGATRQDIRRAYRLRVMENHPDRFPPERKVRQELAMISLGEAYAALMSLPAGSQGAAPARDGAGPPLSREGPAPREAGNGPAALGPLRDPAYAYYKQGFVNFSIAVRGIAEVSRAAGDKRLPSFSPRYRASQDVASSLRLLGAAGGYFTKVVERYPGSVWRADAEHKLARISRFTRLYTTILANLGGP